MAFHPLPSTGLSYRIRSSCRDLCLDCHTTALLLLLWMSADSAEADTFRFDTAVLADPAEESCWSKRKSETVLHTNVQLSNGVICFAIRSKMVIRGVIVNCSSQTKSAKSKNNKRKWRPDNAGPMDIYLFHRLLCGIPIRRERRLSPLACNRWRSL